jgi:hypothetical protein
MNRLQSCTAPMIPLGAAAGLLLQRWWLFVGRFWNAHLLDGFAQHLEYCARCPPGCQQILQRLWRNTDQLMRLLPQVAAITMHRMIDSTQHFSCTSTTHLSSPISMMVHVFLDYEFCIPNSNAHILVQYQSAAVWF